MVVDDDEEMRTAMAALVSDLGFEVVSAVGVGGALSGFGADIAGVVTDVFLPDGSGGDLASEAHRPVPQLPVFFVSAASDAQLAGCLPEGPRSCPSPSPLRSSVLP